jgi:hypothetical protein
MARTLLAVLAGAAIATVTAGAAPASSAPAAAASSTLSCLDESGAPVPWFAVFK